MMNTTREERQIELLQEVLKENTKLQKENSLLKSQLKCLILNYKYTKYDNDNLERINEDLSDALETLCM